MIAIIDYDAGNIKSVEKALEYLGQETVVTNDSKLIKSADKVVLPGVGSFGDAMERLNKYGLTDTIREVADMGKPFLGICLGLQLLFDSSEESPGVEGLGILPGKIIRFPEDKGFKTSKEDVEIGIAIKKGNKELKDAMDAVLGKMTPADFDKMMDEAIQKQPLAK